MHWRCIGDALSLEPFFVVAAKANGPEFHMKLGPMRYCYLTSHDFCSVTRPQTTPEEESCSFQEPEPAGLLGLAEQQDFAVHAERQMVPRLSQGRRSLQKRNAAPPDRYGRLSTHSPDIRVPQLEQPAQLVETKDTRSLSFPELQSR